MPSIPRLPASVLVHSEEIFTSWVIRLAAAHGLNTQSFCTLVCGESLEFNTDYHGPTGDKLIASLGTRTLLSPDYLRRAHTLSGLAGCLFPRVKPSVKIPWVLPHGSYHKRRPAMQFCPWCLDDETPYFRRNWRLSLFTVCPDHFVELRHVCPACEEGIDPVRSDMRYQRGTFPLCWRCGFDLRRTPVRRAEVPDSLMAYECKMAIGFAETAASWPPGISVCDYFVGLSMLCANLLVRKPRLRQWREQAAREAGVILPSPESRHAASAFDTLTDPALRRPVLRTARWLLEDWPERFLAHAHMARTRTSDFVPRFVAAPSWFLEPLQTRLTPLRRKPTATPGLLRARRMREFIAARRHQWWPSRLPRLVRALRTAGFYSPETDDGVIMRSLPGVIARLRTENKDYHRRLTRQVARDTPEWSRLLLTAQPYRKTFCSNPARLRRGIRLLCQGQFLSGRDLSELLHRSQSVLVCRYLIPMTQQGELEAKYPVNGGGNCRAHPRQAYRSMDGGDGGQVIRGRLDSHSPC